MDEAAVSPEGIGAILFYGGRIYRLGYLRGLAETRNPGLASSEIYDLALEMTMVASLYATGYMDQVASGNEVLEREVTQDIRRIQQAQLKLGGPRRLS